MADSGARDLLGNRPLRAWPEITRCAVRSGPEDLVRCLLEGNRRRERRSHGVFLVHIEDARHRHLVLEHIYIYIHLYIFFFVYV